MKFLRSLFGKTDEAPAAPTPQVEAGPDPVMAALAEIEVKRLREALAAAAQAPAPAKAAEPGPEMPAARPSRVVKTKSPLPDGATGPAINIWDLEAGDLRPAAPATQPVAPSPEEAERRRPVRTRTRILGFDAQPAAVAPLLDGVDKSPIADAPAVPGQGHVMYPTGWLVVKSGPGRGAAFALGQGVSHVGRGSDQTVALDFGDMAISRQNHAAVAYDGATHRFHVGHGGKSNLVRLNGKPLLSTEELSDGDEIQIGETTLVLRVLCTPAFNWSAEAAGGDGHDVAIA